MAVIISISDVNSVLTSASLEWGDVNDPEHKILSALREGTVDIDVARIYYTLQLLATRLDEPRMAKYGEFKSPKKGGFARVVDMPNNELVKRIKGAKERKAFEARMNEMFASMRAKKASTNETMSGMLGLILDRAEAADA